MTEYWSQVKDDDSSDDEKIMRAGCRSFLSIAAAVLILLMLCLLCGCGSTRVVTVETVRTDTTYITRHERDSIHVHDSIRIHEAGDTVRIDRWHTKYIESIKHDTTYIAKTDSVPVPYPVEVEVPARLTWWQRIRIYAGGIALSLIGIWLFVKAWRIYTLRR